MKISYLFLALTIFSNVFAQKDLNYAREEIKENLNFSNKHFGRVNFDVSKIYTEINLKRDTFLGPLHFIDAKLFEEGNIIFLYSKFQDDASFYKIDSRESKKKNTINFSHSIFEKQPNFSDAKLHNINFTETKFKNGVKFFQTKFSGKINFKSTIFKETVILNDITLPDILDFSYLNLDSLKGEIDFSTAKRDSISEANGIFCKINLLDTDISKIKLPYNEFELYFPEYTEPVQKMNLYEELLNKMKKDGFKRGYEKLDIEFKDVYYQYRAETAENIWKESWWSVFNTVSKCWWNYGYDKWLVFAWTGGLFLLFTVLNSFIHPTWLYNMYEIQRIKPLILLANKYSDTHTKRCSWYFLRFLIAFYYTSIIFCSLIISVEKLKFTKPRSPMYFFIIYLSGIICLGYITNIIINI